MAKKISKAQEKELQRIRNKYADHLEKERISYAKDLELAIQKNDEWDIQYSKDHLEMANKGYILWISPNSRTLECLQELGYIEYLKKDTGRWTPIDYVKLLDKEVQ